MTMTGRDPFECALAERDTALADLAATKAKLVVLVEALESVVQRAGCRRGMNAQELRGLLWGCEDDAKAAIAAARGGATQ